MPDKIGESMFAPCGMNCMVCYRHCCHRKPCAGCLNSDSGKPEHCRHCEIKDCVHSRGLSYCFACPDYPCKRLGNLEKSYNRRYGASLMAHSAAVRDGGLDAFLEQQRRDFTCPACGGIISLHDAECSECQTKKPGTEP